MTVYRQRKIQVLAYLLLLMAGCMVKPHALTETEIRERVTEDLRGLTANQEPVTAPIDLYEAIARALKYNLETRVKIMQTMLAHQQLDLSNYSLLPQLAVNAGYDGRSNYSGGTARSLITGQQVLEPVTSADLNIFLGNLYLSWDVLDFGLSYIRARQAADNVLIADEEKRRMTIRVIQEVRTAFWRAASAERLLGQLAFLDQWVTKALDNTQAIYDQRLQSPLTPLNYQRDLLNIQREVQRLYRDLSTAKMQLASLMNLPPGTYFELKIPKSDTVIPVANIDLEDMEQRALMRRPELRTIDYQKRINAKEAKAAILELLPNLRLQLGGNFNSNSFFFNQNWLGYASQISWNLLNVFLQPAKLRVIQAQQDVLKAQSLALTMTVLSEVQVSAVQLAYARQEQANAARYRETQIQIADQTHRSWIANSASDLLLIRERVNHVLAEVRFDVAQAGVEAAYAHLMAAVGEDAVPAQVLGHSVAELAQALQTYWEPSQVSNGLTGAVKSNHEGPIQPVSKK